MNKEPTRRTMHCTACGESLEHAVFIALLIDFGAIANDPNYCPGTEDHEHIWKDGPYTVSEEGELG